MKFKFILFFVLFSHQCLSQKLTVFEVYNNYTNVTGLDKIKILYFKMRVDYGQYGVTNLECWSKPLTSTYAIIKDENNNLKYTTCSDRTQSQINYEGKKPKTYHRFKESPVNVYLFNPLFSHFSELDNLEVSLCDSMVLVNNINCYKISLKENSSNEINYLISSDKFYLLSAETIKKGKLLRKIEYSDYRLVDSYYLPFKTKDTFFDQALEGITETEYQEIKINPKNDKFIFPCMQQD